MSEFDVVMADVSGGSGRTLTDDLSGIVFGKLSPGGEMKTLEIDEDAARRDGSLDAQKLRLGLDIMSKYQITDKERITAVLAHAVAEANKLLAPVMINSPDMDSELLQRLQAAFAADYVGEAHVKFHQYLIRCWTTYKMSALKFTSPYGTLMQSSGFGKSKLLHELAKMTATDDEKPSADVSMRVLYVCARNNAQSSGFPRATPKLMELLFGKHSTEESMAAILLKLLTYAQQQWTEMGTKWLELFTDSSADEAVAEAIALASTTDNPVQSESSGQQLVVLVIDEARLLLDLKNQYGVSFFRLLRRALKTANQWLFDNGNNGGIFAVLVDTNAKVHDFTPPRHQDSSSRATEHKAARMLFPPFVLTHTMDILFRNGQAASSSGEGTSTQLRLFNYKASVVHEDPAMRWKSLLSMGRPLWNTYIQREVSLESQQARVLTLAASKLLLGQPDYVRDSYNEGTMFGIAALLCRLGLRPHSSSSLSTRVVADFMGVLHYVSFTNDSHITSYPSEPILAFGAARVWYQLQPDTALETFILPRFQEMLMQRVVDIGDIGEVVARIFLLLAMDEAVMPSTFKSEFLFAGQFCAVQEFLAVLVGTSPVVKMEGGSDVTEKQQTEYDAWIKSWGKWQMSFSQFEDLLEEPTAEMLWLMLARRAAGVLRRNQRGADLVIPMFRGDDISCLLVQVKNREKDDEYPASATTKLLPANVFEETNPLSALHARGMIRLYISLREEEMPAQFVVLTTKQKDYVLCLRGVCKRWQDDERPWSFLSQGVSMQLSEIANSAWWDISARAQSDLKARATSRYSELSTVFPAEELLESVELSLPFSRYGRELQRWKQQQSEMGKRKSGNGKPKRPKGKRKKSRS